jgi:hypothetical protein
MAQVAFQFFEHFIENMAAKKFDFTSDSTCTIKVALVAAANAPDLAADTGVGDLTQISYTNLDGDLIITGITSVQTGGVMPFTADDKTLAAASGNLAAFRYVCYYDDDSTGDLLIGMLDYGSDFTIVDGAEFELRHSFDGGKFGTVSIV